MRKIYALTHTFSLASVLLPWARCRTIDQQGKTTGIAAQAQLLVVPELPASAVLCPNTHSTKFRIMMQRAMFAVTFGGYR